MLGAIIGDVVGSVYEFNNIRTKHFPLFTKNNFFTDDTVMSVAVADILKNKKINNKDAIIDTFHKYGEKYPLKSYGGSFGFWLKTKMREPYYSYGNGSAMRVSACGWYANTPEEVIDYATKVTEVTHNHPEGLKGAIVTAMCVYMARTNKSKEEIRDYVSKFYNLDFDYEELKKNYYFDETCQNTVPQAIYCFLISKNFEDCLKTSISIGGDSDTLCAISCAIAEAYYGISDKIKNTVKKYLPEEMLEVLDEYPKH